MKQFHISDHTLPLWSVFPLHVLNGELCTQVVGDIIQYTSQCTHSYLQCPGNRTAAQTLKVVSYKCHLVYTFVYVFIVP